MEEAVLPTEANLDAINEKIRAASAELKRLQESKRALLLAPWGISEGMVVKLTGRNNGKRALVTSVGTPTWFARDRPWIDGRVQRKDGAWSDRAICLYGDWRLESEDA